MAQSDSKLLVQTTSGPVLGFQDTYPTSDRSTAPLAASGKVGGQSPVNKWLGIPYAQAARWKRPIPPTSWKEPLICHEFGPHFPQHHDGAVVLYLGKPGILPRAWREQSEEKGFNLNVFLPDGLKPDEKVPVLVWIHGGGLMQGSSSTCLYDPTEWIRREAAEGRKFIVVTGNYRVNIFGFLAGSELAAEDEDGLSGNYGLYDCIAYLQWVQDNIAKFGGDPDNVTAFGESAGGSIIGSLLLCEKKLFKNAILQSGFPGTKEFQDIKATNSIYEVICEKAGKVSPGPERLAALRALPASELLNYLPQDIRLSFAVESSPKAIWKTDTVAKTLKEGKWNPYVKSVMVGTTKDEGSMFALLLQTHKSGGYDFMCKTMLTRAPREEIDRLYPVSFPTEKSSGPPDFTTGSWNDAMIDCAFKIPMEYTANILSSTLHAETQEPLPVYMYQLNATVDAIEDGRGLGAFHSIDIPFVFNLKAAWSEGSANAKTSELMGVSWYNFAKSGCPDPTWPQYDSSAPFRKVFDSDGTSTIEDLGIKSEIEKSRYEFWSQTS
ncbi:hypothetical protein CROQUDRAFT_650017 [Cronartium quercuum f. sp. fusiforme G11]|uniref:Carboxylesterase type B domain-containing protein n=1 Tax=Cronartium quercuum f. sp. fusiforme G11 TaxID=708437 RepID=A0A9P6TH80_9BASI|nr:hypothetical protein CROQUDRAFT_650017 [Cronartium quercuum f. sp. fusiforme G11]